MRPAWPGELMDGAAHDHLVLFPSGMRRAFRGVFGVVMNDGAPTRPSASTKRGSSSIRARCSSAMG